DSSGEDDYQINSHDNNCNHHRFATAAGCHWVHAGEEEEAICRKLKYFFMSPCDKYHAKGRYPFKLILQLAKIFFVTAQLVLFGLSNQVVVTFKEENTMTFKHIFLKDYDESSDDSFAVYTQQDVYDHIFYAVDQIITGSTNGILDVIICNAKNFLSPKQNLFILSTMQPTLWDSCVGVNPMTIPQGPLTSNYKNFTLKFHKLINVTIEFQLKAINIQTIINNEIPDCYTFHITIVLDNKAHSGKVKIRLDNQASIKECKDPSISGQGERTEKKKHLLVVMGLLFVSSSQ
uniref:Mucolipin-1-like n=1 Tax=Pundamilia nyererei TaxID=303518 RepID=A0A3B4EVB7_9CICH